MERTTEQSFLHFYSNWVIKGSTIDSELWTINVELYETSSIHELDVDRHIGRKL